MNTRVAANRTPQLSIMLSLIDGEHVVSVFPVGADGEADTTEEFYFRAFGDSTTAIQVYLTLERAMYRVQRDGLDPRESIATAARVCRSEFYPDS